MKIKINKTIVSILVSVLFTVTAFAQIPNNDFESWVSVSGYSSPNGWDNLNRITYNSSIYTCMEGAPGYTGSSFLFLATKTIPGRGLVPGVAVCGTLDTLTYKPVSGFVFSARPQYLSYYMQYMPAVPTDPSSVKVLLTKWNSSLLKRDSIAYGESYYSGMAHTWVNSTTALNYYSGDYPDSAIIVISSSDSVPQNFSTIYIDKLEFIGTVQGIDHLSSPSDYFSIYPNPASDNITIGLNDELKKGEIKIINLLGETVFSQYISKTKTVTLNVEELTAGIYFIQLKSENNFYSRKLMKQ